MEGAQTGFDEAEVVDRSRALGVQVQSLLSPEAGLQKIVLTKVRHAQVVEGQHGVPFVLFFSVSEFLDEIRDGCFDLPGLEGSRSASVAIGGTATGWSRQPIGNRLSAQQACETGKAQDNSEKSACSE